MIVPALCASTLWLERVRARMTMSLNPSRNSISANVWMRVVYLITTIKLS